MHSQFLAANVDGNPVKVPCQSVIRAIRSIRRALYRGEKFEHLNTQVPWMNAEIAYAFRFIKQRLEAHRELAVMDGLYMLERAAEM